MKAPRFLDTEPLAASEFVIFLEAPGLRNVYWTEFSGIRQKFMRAKYVDGLANVERTAMGGVVSYEPITIAKPYDPAIDSAVEKFANNYYGGQSFEAVIRPARRLEGSNPTILRGGYYCGNCKIEEFENVADVNLREGGEMIMIRLTFSVESITSDSYVSGVA